MTRRTLLGFSIAASIAASWAVFCPWANAASAKPSPKELFERRILPIFNSPNPSSCVECHLAGVDLKNYIRPSQEETFVSLRDQGLIDMKKPEASKILRLISMSGEGSKGSALISSEARNRELEAFTGWIKAAVSDRRLRSLPASKPEQWAKPARPNEVIRHARKDHLLESFEQHIWAQRFRCLGCHSPQGSENKKLVAEHGDQVSWIKESSEATMRYLMDSENINTKDIEKSRLLRKPLNEIKHGGGKKMLLGDLGYKAFRAWIQDYANIVNDRYASARELPRMPALMDSFPTEIWLKLEKTPPAWADRLLQVTLFGWDAQRGRWESEPLAASDRQVWGKGELWQHNLLLSAGRDSARAREWKANGAKLPAGKYLLKVHVDTSNRLTNEWNYALGPNELVGQAVIESSWPAGYNRMTKLDASVVKAP